jgi:hypothetical protein
VVAARKPLIHDASINGDERFATTKESGEVQTIRQRDTAQYISDMILELRNLAKAAKLFQVMVPLEYAYYEAFSAANRVEAPAEELEHIRELARAAEGIAQPVEDY